MMGVEDVLDETSDMTVYETNMNLLYDKLIELGFSCVRPSGTFYIFPKALEEDAVAFCNKALKYDLVLVPSDSFGCPGYFRIGILHRYREGCALTRCIGALCKDRVSGQISQANKNVINKECFE